MYFSNTHSMHHINKQFISYTTSYSIIGGKIVASDISPSDQVSLDDLWKYGSLQTILEFGGKGCDDPEYAFSNGDHLVGIYWCEVFGGGVKPEYIEKAKGLRNGMLASKMELRMSMNLTTADKEVWRNEVGPLINPTSPDSWKKYEMLFPFME